jgi:serine/threonine protein kinase
MAESITPDPAQSPVDSRAGTGPNRVQAGNPTPVGTSRAHQPTVPVVSAGTRTRADSLHSLVGYRFDDFELLEEIGRGGMGVVYKARQESLDRVVAVKMLLAEHFRNPVVLARFLSEAKAVAALDHPDIVKIHQIGECDHGHYFVMEYVDGQSLESLVDKGALPIAGVVVLTIILARAIDYAHSKGIIHRDLKPANIMLNRLRRPVIMDFGIAKMVGRTNSVTQEGVVVGTPSFMSPEQASEGSSPVGPASDVYSLGAILYAMLTGHAPFEEKTALATILKVISPDRPPSVRSYRPEVPAELERICLRCLEKRPEDRYPSAQALAEDLKRFRSGRANDEATESPPTRDDPAPAPEPPPPRPAWVAPSAIYLTVQSSGKKVRVSHPVTLIGRSSECDLILRSSDVSKRHCQILLDDDGAWIEDLDSANGITVNDKPVKRSRLKNGDQLTIASHQFKVRIPDRDKS